MLGAHVAQMHRKFLRARIMEASNMLTNQFQMGGLAMKGTDITSSIATSAAAAARQGGHAMLMLFADLESAFYYDVKSFLSRRAQSTGELKHALEIPLALQPLCDTLIAAPALLDLVENPHQLASAVDALNIT
eukprot:7515877-Pyramimonas_sp.AAC.1